MLTLKSISSITFKRLIIGLPIIIILISSEVLYATVKEVNHWPHESGFETGIVDHVEFNFPDSSQILNIEIYKLPSCCSVNYILSKLFMFSGTAVKVQAVPAYHKVNHQIYFGALGAGKYKVDWTAVTELGDYMEGSFQFEVN